MTRSEREELVRLIGIHVKAEEWRRLFVEGGQFGERSEAAACDARLSLDAICEFVDRLVSQGRAA